MEAVMELSMCSKMAAEMESKWVLWETELGWGRRVSHRTPRSEVK